jgi:glycosyltransferase involved in cell wall biosynthesis
VWHLLCLGVRLAGGSIQDKDTVPASFRHRGCKLLSFAFDSGRTPERPELELSILIPIYNTDITKLLDCLVKQIVSTNVSDKVEILLIDDCSSCPNMLLQNKKSVASHEHPGLRYITLQKNVGRANVRNLLALKSFGKYLLFLDSDVIPERNDFIADYFEQITAGKPVVCGGICYRQRLDLNPECNFYLYFSGRTDAVPASARNKAAWAHLHTSNVLIKRDCFEQTPFDDRFTKYGYEDAEWSIRLMKKYEILHIDNAVSHLGLIPKAKFYSRMRESIDNYWLVMTLHPEVFKDRPLSSAIKVLEKLPAVILKVVDRLLQKAFFLAGSHLLAYIVFQANKAVLLVIRNKERLRSAFQPA